MPKTKKRSESRRAERINRAHSTALPKLEAKGSSERRSTPGYKPPARGIARYPWASVIVLLALLAAIFGGLYALHLPPFPSLKSHTTTTTTAAKSTPKAAATTTATTAASPCTASNILAEITKTGTPSADYLKSITHTYSSAKQVVDNNKIYCAGINTNRGLIVVELDPKIAPKTVNNFVFLAQNHFYDGLTFHRVLSQSSGGLGIAQGGDPTGTGSGGPGYKFNDEPVQGNYTAGTLAMANSGANTNGSQFFINTSDNSSALQKQYNLFGHVVQGLNVAQSLTLRDPSTSAGASVKPDVMNYVIVTAAS